jgi:hypothetical protein
MELVSYNVACDFECVSSSLAVVCVDICLDKFGSSKTAVRFAVSSFCESRLQSCAKETVWVFKSFIN